MDPELSRACLERARSRSGEVQSSCGAGTEHVGPERDWCGFRVDLQSVRSGPEEVHSGFEVRLERARRGPEWDQSGQERVWSGTIAVS